MANWEAPSRIRNAIWTTVVAKGLSKYEVGRRRKGWRLNFKEHLRYTNKWTRYPFRKYCTLFYCIKMYTIFFIFIKSIYSNIQMRLFSPERKRWIGNFKQRNGGKTEAKKLVPCCSRKYHFLPTAHTSYSHSCAPKMISLWCVCLAKAHIRPQAPHSFFLLQTLQRNERAKKRNKKGVETKKRALQISHLPAGTGKKGVPDTLWKGNGRGELSCRVYQVEGFGAHNIPYNCRIEES